MAKQIDTFEIVIRGTKSEGPTEAFVQYKVTDSVNTDLKKGPVRKTLSSPNFNKTVHNANSSGEFWYDEVAAAETDEGIS